MPIMNHGRAGLTLVLASLPVLACGSPGAPAATPASSAAGPPAIAKAGSFASDVAWLGKYGKIVVLEAPAERGKVAVAPGWQGRVMTSAFDEAAPGLGFVHRSFIEAGKTGTPFDNYGGEDRFWLGPEGGQFGLYFPKGKPFAFAEWQTPHEMQEGAWPVTRESGSAITLAKRVTVDNWTGTRFVVDVEREISVLSGAAVAASLAVKPEGLAKVRIVAYQTRNRITNAGEAAWKPETGLLSIWILGMFNPAPDMHVLVPFEKEGAGEIVNDRYFGKVPADRLSVRLDKGFLDFVCDGKHRSKIGLGPARARSVLGSYSRHEKLLTLVKLAAPPRGRYVNSMWEQQKDPYGGDAINSYNDGPTEPGKPALGGFYEIESSSPAAELAKGASLEHVHATFHFTGEEPALDAIARAVLGIALSDVAR